MLAIPEPTEVKAIDVPDLCDAAVATASDLDDIEAIDEMRKRLTMIGTYLDMTSIEGCNAINSALRRMEIRIGVLLGPPEIGSHSSAVEGSSLTKDQRSHFRKLAEYSDVVEEVIAESDDTSPASRRKALDAIRQLADLEAQEEAIGPKRERPEPPKSDLFDLTAIRMRLEGEWTFPWDHHDDVTDELRSISAAVEHMKELHSER